MGTGSIPGFNYMYRLYKSGLAVIFITEVIPKYNRVRVGGGEHDEPTVFCGMFTSSVLGTEPL